MQQIGINMKKRVSGRDDVVQINVGGTLFSTLACTLTKHDSMLKRCLEDERHELSCDVNGISFLDLDPVIFVYILNWMRLGQFFLTPVHAHFDQVGYMADYLGLEDLLKEMQWRELKRDGVISVLAAGTTWKIFVYDKIEKKCTCRVVSIQQQSAYKNISFVDEATNKVLLTCSPIEKVTDDFIQNKIKEIVFL